MKPISDHQVGKAVEDARVAEAVERLRESLWATWGRNRQTTDWPSRAQLRDAFLAAIQPFLVQSESVSSGEAAKAREELRDDLEDAIRRAYAEGWNAGAPDYEPIDQARVLADPDRMRQVSRIQSAAWAVVGERVEGAASPQPEDRGGRDFEYELHDEQCAHGSTLNLRRQCQHDPELSEVVPAALEQKADTLQAILDSSSSGGSSGVAKMCDRPPRGWRCTREAGHAGPCAAVSDAPDFTVNAPEILPPDQYLEVAELVKAAHEKMRGTTTPTNSGDVEERGEEEGRLQTFRGSARYALVQLRKGHVAAVEDTLALIVGDETRELGLRDRRQQPNPEPHLSGDGELEAAADSLEVAANLASEKHMPTTARIWSKRAADLRDLASRLSSEDSSGVDLNRSLVSRLVDAILILLSNGWDEGPLNDLQDRLPEVDDRVQSLFDRGLIENRRDPCDDVETYATSAGFDLIREAVLAATLTQPVSPQPDSTTGLSEGTE